MIKDNIAKRVVPSEKQLIELSGEHLYYEIWMLFEVAELVKKETQGTPIFNALLESFIVHAGILIEFFCDLGSHPSIASVTDYVTKAKEWKDFVYPYERYFVVVRQRRNAELAHLSYDRLNVRPQNKLWHGSTIMRHMKTIISQFLDTAEPKLLHPRMYELRAQFFSKPPVAFGKRP